MCWFRGDLRSTALLVLLAGCQVRPEKDYARVGDLVHQRVSVERVYSPTDRPDAEPAVGSRLTLEQAIQSALLSNRELQAAFGSVGAARADVVQSMLLKNPVLALSARFPEGGGRTDLTVAFAQQIVDLWQIPIRKKIAETELDQAVFTLVQQVVEIVRQVKQSYHRLQYLRESVEIARQNVAITRRLDETAKARFESGATGRIDADLAHAALLQAQLSVIDVERQVQVEQNQLAVLLGLNRWPGTVGLDPPDACVAPPVALDRAVDLAIEDRADLVSARKTVDTAIARVRDQYNRIFPSIEAGFELERTEGRAAPGRKILADTARSSIRNGSLTAPDIQTRAERRLQRRMQIDAILGPTVTLTLPVFDQNQAQIAKAKIELEQQSKRLEAMEQQVERDVRTAVANFAASESTVHFYEEQLIPQLQQNLETASTSYRAGSVNILVVMEAQRAIVSSSANVNRARMERVLAEDALEAALGGPLILQRAAGTSEQQDSQATQPAERP